MDTLFLFGEVSLETKKDNDATTSQKFGSQNVLAHFYMAITGDILQNYWTPNNRPGSTVFVVQSLCLFGGPNVDPFEFGEFG